MFYAFAFLLFAAALIFLAVTHSGWCWLLLWPAASFAIVAIAYVTGPAAMGKRADGRFAWWATILLLPFRMITHVTWLIGKTIAAEPTSAEIAPGVWMGRRLRASELPADTAMIIDMTSELADPRDVRERPGYLCLPTLDASAPDEAAFKAALE